jgi:hypothetical protein
MGTTLTGTTPQDTYDSLIKVTDNGPLTGSLKKLTDGLGNDSSLSLSTTAASLSGNLTSTGSASFTGSVASASSAGEQAILQGGYLQFYNAAATDKFIKLTDDSSTIDGVGFRKSGAASTIWFPTGNVGIGTSSPAALLEANGAIRSTRTGAASQHLQIEGGDASGGFITLSGAAKSLVIRNNCTSSSDIQFDQAVATRFSFTQAGTQILRIDADGVKFGTDSAAANALDDYEEGTWTPVLRGSSTAGTYELSTASGNYTKIGRQVSVNCRITLAASITGGGSGYAQITGLPFNNGSVSIGCLRFSGVDFVGNFVNVSFIGASGVSTVYFPESVDNAPTNDLDISGFSALDTVDFSITYFV